MKDILNKILIEDSIELTKSLEKIGITVMNEEGNMKTLYEVFKEVSEVWSKAIELDQEVEVFTMSDGNGEILHQYKITQESR